MSDEGDKVRAKQEFFAHRTEMAEEEWVRLYLAGVKDARSDSDIANDDPYALGYMSEAVRVWS